MIPRGIDRRIGPRSWPIPGEQRRQFERRGRPTQVQRPETLARGSIRPAPGEAAPFFERRRVPESGME